MHTITPAPVVPGPRRPADDAGRPAVTIRTFADGETRPERCNSASGRGCHDRPVCRTTVTRVIRRLGCRDEESVQPRNACARHSRLFCARHGIPLPAGVPGDEPAGAAA